MIPVIDDTTIEFTSRYEALGVPLPDPKTMCKGQCEGTGIYPQFLAGPWLKPSSVRLIQEESVTEEEIKRWHTAHLESEHETSQEPPYETVCDGWHFITCPDCNGTGRAP